MTSPIQINPGQGQSTTSDPCTLPSMSDGLKYLPDDWLELLKEEEELLQIECAYKQYNLLKQKTSLQKNYLDQFKKDPPQLKLENYTHEQVENANKYLRNLRNLLENDKEDLNQKKAELSSTIDALNTTSNQKKEEIETLLKMWNNLDKERVEASKKTDELQSKYDNASDVLKDILKDELTRAINYSQSISTPEYKDKLKTNAKSSYDAWVLSRQAIETKICEQNGMDMKIAAIVKQLEYLDAHKNGFIDKYITSSPTP